MGVDAAPVLGFAEDFLDPVTLAIECPIAWDPHLPIGF